MTGTSKPNNDEVNLVLARMADPGARPLFIHCMKGEDRTGLLVALHRVINEGWKPADAHAEMMAHGFNSLLLELNHYFEDKTHWED